jgi:hypothetical protein
MVKVHSQSNYSTLQFKRASFSTHGRHLGQKTENQKAPNNPDAEPNNKNSKGNDKESTENKGLLEGLKKVAKKLWVIAT